MNIKNVIHLYYFSLLRNGIIIHFFRFLGFTYVLNVYPRTNIQALMKMPSTFNSIQDSISATPSTKPTGRRHTVGGNNLVDVPNQDKMEFHFL